MKTLHIKSHNILMSGDGENTVSLQFNALWIKFVEEGATLKIQAHQCSFINTVTARGEQGRIKRGETIRSDRAINKVFGKLQILELANKHQDFSNLNFVANLFPLAVANFNNLIYNIKSYNRAHFEEGKGYYNTRKSYGKKYLDNSFLIGTTGPLLGNTLKAASVSIKVFSYLGSATNAIKIFTPYTFSNLYDNLIKMSTKKPVIIVDFDHENDSLRDSAGHIIRAYREKIIDKRDEKISAENIFEAMYNGISDYIDGYVKRANKQQ